METNKIELDDKEKELKEKIIDIVDKYLYSDTGKPEVDVCREIYKQVRDTYDI